MTAFQNDKAILQINSLCNSGDPTVVQDPYDSLIRLCNLLRHLINKIIKFFYKMHLKVIYFQLSDDSSLQNQTYIAAGVNYSPYELFVGQLLFYKGVVMKMKANSTPYTFINTSNLIVNQGEFGISNLLFKISPNSQYSYNIKSSIIGPGSGYASLCTIITTNTGQNIPCQKRLDHSFTSSIYIDNLGNNYNIKNSDFVYSGSFCSTSKINISKVNQKMNELKIEK